MKSTKKTLGIIGCAVIWFISIFSLCNNRNESGIITLILVQNIGLVIALFGIKTWGGLKSKKIDSNYHQEENDER